MKRFILSLIVIAAAAMTVFAQEYTETSLTVGDKQRKVRIHVPDNLPADAPLVISYHGFNQDPEYQMRSTNWNEFADLYSFAVAYPYYEGFWDLNGDKDVDFTRAIIDYMSEHHKIDRKRVYATGFSLGAMMTYHLIGKMASEIAAFAPVSGVRFDNKKPMGDRHVPLIHHHGSNDDVFKFGGDPQHRAGGYPAISDYVAMWAEWNGCDMTAKKEVKVGNDTHITWTNDKEGIETRYNIIDGAGHWHSNNTSGEGTYTTKEIWEFVSRYSLDGK